MEGTGLNVGSHITHVILELGSLHTTQGLDNKCKNRINFTFSSPRGLQPSTRPGGSNLLRLHGFESGQ